ncbi:phosphoribosyltransferase [Streptomyces albiaxialis]|uniref:phosphoribosyltransferase n=1 Tax=Streptomyces albiaxialis TaxID=329523 RepID=UPI0031E345AD
MRFRDRLHAGEELAGWFEEWADTPELRDPLVLALPRGGVPVGVVVARALGAPLDVLVAAKIGVPGHPESGIGALAGEDPPLYDHAALSVLGMTEDDLAPDTERVREEVRRRERLYRGDRPKPAVRGRSVIVVDDGLATGVTARAALRSVRPAEPERLVLAVPVCSPHVLTGLRDEADVIACPHRPEDFLSVGQWYDDFSQVTDAAVLDALHAGAAGRRDGPDAGGPGGGGTGGGGTGGGGTGGGGVDGPGTGGRGTERSEAL